jgi:methylenetetrahydrofolate reductase (NADPH)
MQGNASNRLIEVELLSPKQKSEKLEAELSAFSEKWRLVIDQGYMTCVPDNPMGNLSFQGTDLIRELGLPSPAGQVSIHLNTFHTKRDLDEILQTMVALGLRHLLLISGDGSVRLPKLPGRDIGFDVPAVTSVELLRYVHREYPGKFDTGVAFNPYEPLEHETEKLHRKIDAGAQFVITQPIVDRHPAVDSLMACGLPVIIECWMSKKIHLLSACVGYEIPEDTPYDPLANLQALMRHYPSSGLYLAICGFKTQFPLLGGIFGNSPASRAATREACA